MLVAALEAMDAARSGGGGDEAQAAEAATTEGRSYWRASAPMLRRISLGRSGSVRTSTTLTTPDASARSRAGRTSASDSTRSPWPPSAAHIRS